MKQHSSSFASSSASPFNSRGLIWILSLLFLAIWFYMLGSRTLVPTDEGRYAEMAREMLVTGDWVTPRLDGIKYFEKPPLQAWMNVITFELFGVGEWQARLWTGLCGLLGVALVAHTGRKVFNSRVGINAALVLGSSVLWAASAHYNSLDMAVAGMMTITLCGVLLGQRADASDAEQRNGMLLCWAGMALAVLTKGLIGVVLPGAVLVIYTFVSRDWAIWKRLHMGKGLLLFFAIATPWFVLVALKNPEHPHFFFIHEHLDRFTSNVHKRNQPAYFFIGILAIGIVPWLGLLLQGMWAGVKRENRGFQPRQMLLVWTIFIFVFFSASHSKLTGYILPIFPSLALLIACQLEAGSSKSLRFAAGLFTLTGLGTLAFALMAPAKFASSKLPPLELALNQAAMPWVIAVSLVIIAGGLLAFVIAKDKRDWAVISLAAAGFLASQLLLLGYEPWGYYRAGLLQLKPIQAELKPDTPLYGVGLYEQCLPFYLGRTMIPVEFPDELAFGLEQEPHLWIPERKDFMEKWRAYNASGKLAIAIVRVDVYEDMLKQGLPMRIVGQDPRRVVVASTAKAAAN
ncbi:ArnT family glycosyltransferase [Undibacterium terreum]|uniref:4-amino-4-deoxy-L-arabinose transferase n=1 Tax=Undibacterium terreum TaxID=1224302 RepID=A0A916XS29_9BURK|nr:glycosyltransferase family 39 protein [Undibacterium terreum]GGD01804.1 4-amino-4-deoxy-L-arabinose transferase [Undibacterium terreum]